MYSVPKHPRYRPARPALLATVAIFLLTLAWAIPPQTTASAAEISRWTAPKVATEGEAAAQPADSKAPEKPSDASDLPPPPGENAPTANTEATPPPAPPSAGENTPTGSAEASPPPTPVAENTPKETECATSQCHPALAAKQPPLPKGHADCRHCHQDDGKTKSHPQTGEKTFTLTPDSCLGCHQKITDYDYLHPPVAAGDCLVCHTFHSSNPALIAEGSEQVLCSKCHRPVTREGDTQLHGDVAKKKCTSCHTVHGSFFKHLLAGPYSTDFFNDYDEKHYSLCFQCHKIDLLLHPNTSYNTNFRDGKRNLHYVHVNRTNRGRSCKLCHGVHSSPLPKLMADKVSFGDWEMPVNFVITDSGGRCTPGCHAPAAYDRSKLSLPGSKSNAPE